MYKITLIAAILFQTGSLIAQNESQGPAMPPEREEPGVIDKGAVYNQVEETASFKGGRQALINYLSENIKYPQSAIEAGIQGSCYLTFVVTKKGKITNVSVAKKVPDCPECDAEAVRVVKKMPKWTPAKVKGKKVNSYYNLPIIFKLT